MRQKLKINDGWIFIMENVGIESVVQREGRMSPCPTPGMPPTGRMAEMIITVAPAGM